MGAVGGLLGVSGGASGTGFKSPSAYSVQQGATVDQANQAYNGAQSGIAGQQALLAALQGQNGLGAQTGVYNQAQALADRMGSISNVGKQNDVYDAQRNLANQQQDTAQQYQNIANGTGPNPAQAMLNQATGANVANQAALMAGQRGAGSNVGLMARQAAQQGANTQQQAAGQAAVMQANQQIAGLQGLSSQQQAIGTTQQNAGNLASTMMNQQQAQQAALAQQAAAMTQNQIAATTGLSQAQQAEQKQVLDSINAQNSANVGMQSNINSTNAGLATAKMGSQDKLMGGLGNALGSALNIGGGGAAGGKGEALSGKEGANSGSDPGTGSQAPVDKGTGADTSDNYGETVDDSGGSYKDNQAGGSGWASHVDDGNTAARGGEVKAADGGQVGLQPQGVPQQPQGPMSSFGQFLSGWNKPVINEPAFASENKEMSQGGMAQTGGSVQAKSPDQRAVKSGNSYDNDKVPAMLSEGEVVIPRSVMQSGDPAGGAARFIQALMAKKGK